jgi:hypothetical protein
MAGRGKSEDPEHPSAPGWYPDPWSATGEGERYYDGKKWGTTTKPLARHSKPSAVPASVTSISSKRRSKRTEGVRSSWARFKHTYGPLALLILAIAVVWAIPKLRSHHSTPTAPELTESSSTPAKPVENPPAGTEEASSPIGTPAAVPKGSGKFEVARHQTDAPDVPVAWDPCRPIHYVVNSTGAPTDGLALIRSAIARVHTATGLEFINDGSTTEKPNKERATYLPAKYNADRWAPVLISWSNETAYPSLAGPVAGVTEAQPVFADENRLVYVTGQVTLDAQDLSKSRTPDRTVAEAIALHELGHLVGLDHTSDRHQIMYSEAQFNVRDYGVGDLKGLSLLGKQACFPDV